MFRKLTIALAATTVLGAGALAPTSASAFGHGGFHGFHGGYHGFHHGWGYGFHRYGHWGYSYGPGYCYYYPDQCYSQ